MNRSERKKPVIPPTSPRGSAQLSQQQIAGMSAASWDDLRLCLACVEAGSFRKAAQRLGLSDKTLIRRITRLERLFGRRLFLRTNDGLMPTDDALFVMSELHTMQQANLNMIRKLSHTARVRRHVVKLAISDGLGTYWVVPHLSEFSRERSDIIIDMECAVQVADVARLQADIAINFTKPEQSDLVVTQLGFLHAYPFVSAGYAATYGVPSTKREALSHRLILQSSPLLDMSTYARIFEAPSIDHMVAFSVNSSVALLYAVEKSVGIGFLPTHALALGANLVPVDIDVKNRLTVWMSYHPTFKDSAAHRAVLTWLREIFDPRTYPCFREQFIHPNELVSLMAPNLSSLRGSGYAAALLAEAQKFSRGS